MAHSLLICVNGFDIVIETHLCSKINEIELNIEVYSFKHCDQPNDTSRGGIRIYYKSFLPCIFKPELNETLLFQVKVGTRKCFFTCIYRNPSSEVDKFANELNNTLNNIKGKNPDTNFIIGDRNAKNTTWWGDTTGYPGETISNITGLHGLHEIINEPTNFYPGKTPSCIDLIFCSQPNLITESGVFTLSSLPVSS